MRPNRFRSPLPLVRVPSHLHLRNALWACTLQELLGNDNTGSIEPGRIGKQRYMITNKHDSANVPFADSSMLAF